MILFGSISTVDLWVVDAVLHFWTDDVLLIMGTCVFLSR
jgi:hypothetical protein